MKNLNIIKNLNLLTQKANIMKNLILILVIGLLMTSCNNDDDFIYDFELVNMNLEFIDLNSTNNYSKVDISEGDFTSYWFSNTVLKGEEVNLSFYILRDVDILTYDDVRFSFTGIDIFDNGLGFYQNDNDGVGVDVLLNQNNVLLKDKIKLNDINQNLTFIPKEKGKYRVAIELWHQELQNISDNHNTNLISRAKIFYEFIVE